MQIGRKDVAWNFLATFMRVASGVIVLPLVLKQLPTDEVALWVVFLAIGSFATLLDFGFSNSFSRNVTYIFSGAKSLQSVGFQVATDTKNNAIDYGLLKSVIAAMRKYYGIIALAFFAVFVLTSPFYFRGILENKYSGNNKSDIWIAWFSYGFLVAYQIYTFYYSTLLSGRGYVKQLNQIAIVSQTSRIVASVIFLLLNFGIMSLVVGQLVSDIINRLLCYISFYDQEMKQNLKKAVITPIMEIMKIMTPNALKIGLTTLGTFLLGKGIVLIAADNPSLTLAEVASFGITKQMIDIIMSLSTIWFSTFYAKMTMHRVKDEMNDVKRMYIKGNLTMMGVYLVCGAGLVLVGPYLVSLIRSNTPLLPTSMMIVLLIGALLDSNQNMATSFLLTGNEVPFMKAAIFTGILCVSILYFGLHFTTIGIWGMIIAPVVALSVYSNWKWPLVVYEKLGIKPVDYLNTTKSLIKDLRK